MPLPSAQRVAVCTRAIEYLKVAGTFGPEVPADHLLRINTCFDDLTAELQGAKRTMKSGHLTDDRRDFDRREEELYGKVPVGKVDPKKVTAPKPKLPHRSR